MTKTEYRDYIDSPHWQQRRKQFLQSHIWCRLCYLPRWLAGLVYNQDLHVHHVSYANLGEELDEDLRALCRRCHEVETFGRSDLRAPVSHACPTCGDITWDRFADDCSACSNTRVGGCLATFGLLRSQLENHTKFAVWQAKVCYVAAAVGVDAVLDCMCEEERFIGYLRKKNEPESEQGIQAA